MPKLPNTIDGIPNFRTRSYRPENYWRDDRSAPTARKVNRFTATDESEPLTTTVITPEGHKVLLVTFATDAENVAALHMNRYRSIRNGEQIHHFDRPDGKRVICHVTRTGVERQVVEILTDDQVLPDVLDLFGEVTGTDDNGKDIRTVPSDILDLLRITRAVSFKAGAYNVTPGKGTKGGRPNRVYPGVTIFTPVENKGDTRAIYAWQSRQIAKAGYTGRKDPRYLADLSALHSCESPQHSWAASSQPLAVGGKGRR